LTLLLELVRFGDYRLSDHLFPICAIAVAMGAISKSVRLYAFRAESILKMSNAIFSSSGANIDHYTLLDDLTEKELVAASGWHF